MSILAVQQARAKDSSFLPPARGLLQRKCACGAHRPGGSTCGSCAGGNGPQGRLAVGPSNDPLEHEADRVAEAALAGPKRAKVTAASVRVGRLAAPGPDRSESAPASVHKVLGQSGNPLESGMRGDMESRFGRDFSNVRVHQGDSADQSARDVGAKAYTVGRDIVFAAGQYAPATTGGRRLIAHELAHVAQQGAATMLSSANSGPAPQMGNPSARLLQRVPAAPSYNTVTGTVAISKLQFTPIPDITAGGLAAPLELTPTLSDPSLIHLSWELYDPTDDLIAGFSTLPGNATSKNSKFTLEPRMFTAKATTGRYTMRLVGRNAAHEPIAYFDRYFFVHAKDLVTGTPSKGGFGELKFVEYGKTDGDFAAGTDYVVDIKMEFQPTADAITCGEIGFIQTLESSDPQGKSNHRFAGAAKAARATPGNYSIDRAPTGPAPFYGTFRNAASGKIEPSGTTYIAGKGGHVPVKAVLEDHPSWSQPTMDRFESCVTCRSGANAGQVYGCVTWGFAADRTGKVTLMPRGYSGSPSDTLKASLSGWNTWRAAQTTPTDFEEGPTLK